MSRKLLAAFAVLALVGLMSGTAHAQFTSDYRTYFTFSGPVTLPGVTLPAGKYLFRIPDTNGDRRVIQVLNAEGTRPYAMLLSIPSQRRDPPKDPEVRFMETAAGMPPAIKIWWYPGNRTGWEFIYPKAQALRLAKASNESVLTVETSETTTEAYKTADLERVSPSGEETRVSANANNEATATSGQVQQGQVASDRPVQEGTLARNRTSLPKTASATPLALLLGSLALCAGLCLRLWQRRRVES